MIEKESLSINKCCGHFPILSNTYERDGFINCYICSRGIGINTHEGLHDAIRKWNHYIFTREEKLMAENAKKVSEKQYLRTLISENIKKLRQDRGLSTTQVASQAKLCAITLKKIETGIIIPSLLTMIRLSKLFDVSLDEMIKK